MAQYSLLSAVALNLFLYSEASLESNLTYDSTSILDSNKELNSSTNSVPHFVQISFPGGVVLSTVITLIIVSYLFLFLVKVCDCYFISTIKVIGRKIGLSSDVAGATLMAAAVSSPDLFMNIIGTFVTEGDIGIGTIVGCGLFNTLAVPALCILLTSQNTIRLNAWALTRDTIFYCTSLLILTISLTDNMIAWHEGLILVSIYLLYLLFLSINTLLRTKTEDLLNYCIKNTSEDRETKIPILLKSHSILSYGGDDDTCSEFSEDDAIPWWKVLSRIITFPIDTILRATVPLPHKEVCGYKLYPVTFVICLVWIGIISYIVAWMITIAGFELNISDSFLGLTFIAIGMGVPEAASSVIVARRGDGAMALSNSMGSSIFDTLVCLGVPWLLRAGFSKEHSVHIGSRGIAYTSVLLIVSIIVLYCSAVFSKFRLNRTVNINCFAIYFYFLTIV